MSVKVTTLHIVPDRQERFAALSPKVWLEASFLRTWMIAEPRLIVGLLRDSRAVILNVEHMIESIEKAYGVAFPHVRFAARHLPLFLEGKIHAERRRSFSRYLAGRMADLEAKLPKLVKHRLEPLRRKGTVELVSEVTSPLVRDINSIFVERPVSEEIGALNLLDLFALNKSLQRFKDLDRRAGEAIAFLGHDGQDESILGSRFSLLTMGFETLLTMLTESLHMAFRLQPAETQGPIILPDFPVETGVPISYRRAAADFEMAGHAFKAGDLLRLQLQALGYSAHEPDNKWIFGAGTHSCVGKQVTLHIWKEFKQVFDGMGVSGRIGAIDLVPSHYVVRHNFIHAEVF
jgi:cytochrome P450